jgi:VWFA-related protein
MLGRFLSLVLAGSAVLAQPQPAGPKPQAPAKEAEVHQAPFRVQINEVIVPITVTDEKNRFVSNLEAKDFRIFDEGREQKVVYFSREQKQPVVVGFLLDMSNATRLHWKTFQEAALELVWNLLPGDKRFSGFLVTYSNDAELAVNTTSDPEKIVERIRKLKPGGGSSLFDAIYLSCTRRNLVEGEPIEPRRVLIVIGDGNDNASKKSINEVIEIAQRNLVTIYGVSTVAFGFTSEGEANLTRLVEETGGRVEYPLQGLYSSVSGYLSTPSDEGNYALKVGTGAYAAEIASGIFKAVSAVAGEVTTQYVLRYVPDSLDSPKQYRTIRVEVDLPNVKVRARKGYYPFAP